jgi:hypothetical protein
LSGGTAAKAGQIANAAALPTVPTNNVRRSMIIVFPPDATSTLRIGVNFRFATVSIGADVVFVSGRPHCSPSLAARFPPMIIDVNGRKACRKAMRGYYILLSTVCFANNMRNKMLGQDGAGDAFAKSR